MIDQNEELIIGPIVCMEADSKNPKNGVVYPKSVLEDIVEQFNALPPGRILGGFGDDTPTLAGTTHIVKTLEIKDNRLVATVKIIDSPVGRILRETLTEIAKSGVKHTISGWCAGTGYLTENPDGTSTVHDYVLKSISISVESIPATSETELLPEVPRK